ncbi:MAG: PQQ-dependent sugar dehydrogenase [Actinomycetota bacterium]|mgnify:CR=1 FL=1
MRRLSATPPPWASLGMLTVLALLATACSGDAESVATLGSSPDVTFATQEPVESAATSAPPASTTIEPATTGATATSSPAPATTVEEPLGDPAIALVQVGGAEQPVDIAWRNGDATAFVVERPGRVVPMRGGQTGPPVLDIGRITSSGGGEQGLLGLTFNAAGDRAYVNHTNDDGDTVIAEYTVGDDGSFDPASRRELLTIGQPYENHNGGNVTIGPDGMLYIGMGDGGSGGDPERHALNVSSLLGKILRIDPAPSAGLPYTVPGDNPFVDVVGARPEIWSVGVRNPWRFSFDLATADLWIADVGQNEIEEIDVAWADQGGGRGLNFGWSAFEGTARFNEDQSPDGVTPPIYEYRHGDECSVTGGAVYRGSIVPSLVGWYVFSDYCSGNLYGLRVEAGVLIDTLLLGKAPSVTAVRHDLDGELFVLSANGQINQVVAA